VFCNHYQIGIYLVVHKSIYACSVHFVRFILLCIRPSCVFDIYLAEIAALSYVFNVEICILIASCVNDYQQ